ncbi:hypothetical protein RvY_01438 [Ramazzottius varieornatus]|uniref:Uncharacterized protein n=1 Tax=Ramazzottius varieornatus TaxID=947166 RepID=A0A1D1UK78_RAMVA|nr:hypothetical protein RvY_01438 [Ramazzottius varieornatus]
MIPRTLGFKFPFASLLFVASNFLPFVSSTWRYYYPISYATGDSMFGTSHMHGGTNLPFRKWQIECLDGEALIGTQDWTNDYERIEAIYCKFMFPNKPPSMGVYPYYPYCYVKNYTADPFCFDRANHTRTVDTFITGLWDDDQQFLVWRIPFDDTMLYKCCRVPGGYYIDYVSCYYMPTHDNYWEYYDSTQQNIVQCGTGYVMTGIAKKINPTSRVYNLEWLQCCRLGFGPPQYETPPVVYSSSNSPTYQARSNIRPTEVTPEYKPQYRAMAPENDCGGTKPGLSSDSISASLTGSTVPNGCSSRYRRKRAARPADEEEDHHNDVGYQWFPKSAFHDYYLELASDGNVAAIQYDV